MATIDAADIVDAIRAIYNPSSSAEVRRQAHQFLEIVQDSCAMGTKLAEIGFDLASRNDYSVEIRRCGLQFVDHCVKFSWYTLSDEERQRIKVRCFEGLASTEEDDLLLQTNSGKDGLARVLVEIAKREWPQNWPSFLTDCEKMCNNSKQTEVIFLVLLRLVEDVCIFQNMENTARRRELYNGLVTVAPDVLKLSIDVLRRYIGMAMQNFADKSSHATAEYLQVSHCVLQFLSSLMEWVPAKDLKLSQDLLPLLCQLLVTSAPYTSVQVDSANCLLQLVTRKHGSKEEMSPAMELFNEDQLSLILAAARTAETRSLNREHYIVLKLTCNILCALGQTLCLLWGKGVVTNEPATFGLYLNALFAFFEHPSVTLRLEAASTLASFSSQDEIKKCQTFVAMLPSFVGEVRQNTRRIGFPSKDEGPQSHYSLFDYENDAEFLVAWNKFREFTLKFLRHSIAIDPQLAYNLGRKWLLDVIATINIESPATFIACYELELEALNRILPVLILAFSKTDVFTTPEVLQQGRELLTSIVSILQTCKVPTLMNHLMSTASALFPFLAFHGDLVPAVVSVVFHCANFCLPVEEKMETQCRDLRHHAMHEFVRLSVDFTDQLIPHIDDLLPEIFVWGRTLSPRQKCGLVEGLTALSNRFNDFNRQRAFILDVLKEYVEYWTSPALSEGISGPESFMNFTGISTPAPTVWADGSIEDIRRKELLNASFMLCSVLNRSSVPENPEDLQRGQFVTDYRSQTVSRHPAFDVFQPLFVNVFSLARCLNGLYTTPAIAKIHPSFGGVKAIDVPDVEKYSVHAAASAYVLVGRSETDKMFQKLTIADHLKAYLADLCEQVQILIGLFASKFRWQFFGLPQASNFLLHGCVAFVEDTLDLRFRLWIRRSFLSIVEHVGDINEHFLVVSPALSKLLNAAYTRLQSRWDVVTKRREEMAATDSSGDLTHQEVYLEDVTCLLTRELVLLIRRMLGNDATSRDTQQPTFNADDSIDDDDVAASGDVAMENGSNLPLSQGVRRSSEFVQFLCDPSNGCVGPITLILFNTLAWLDTTAAIKAIPLCGIISDKLTSTGVLDEQTAIYLFCRTLSAIQLHGEHDNAASPLLALSSLLYERWFQKYPSIRDVLISIPDCSEAALKIYDTKFLDSTPSRTVPEKARKDGFKKLVKSIIGTNIGQQFKRTMRLRDLPPLWKPKRSKVNDTVTDLGICNLFGPAETSN